MGLTPVEGLMMGSRVGDLDSGVLLFIMDKEEMGTTTANSFVNKHCGVLGISGISSDIRVVLDQAEKGDHAAELAIDAFVYRIKKFIGAY